ncbi:MAG: HDIG domain-containing metalloprotein [Aristaeellaceae bacterium]
MINPQEIAQLLSTRAGIASMNAMTRAQLTDLFGESVSRLQGYDQHNPHHHLDLLTHTTAVMASIDDTLLSPGDAQTLRLAALLHDVGKPDVAKDKDGRHVFYGHPGRSAEIAWQLLASYGYPDGVIRRVCFFIAFHDAFINFRLPEELTPQSNPHLKPIAPDPVAKQLRRIRREAETKYGYHPSPADITLLLHMVAADASAQADVAFLHGKVCDTRQNKLRRVRRLAGVVRQLSDENDALPRGTICVQS